MVALVPAPGQLPLIQFVESDDHYLQDQLDVLWADVLPNLDYRRFQALRGRWVASLVLGQVRLRGRAAGPLRVGLS